MCTYSYTDKNLLISSIALSIVHLVNLEPIPLMSHLTRDPLITNPEGPSTRKACSWTACINGMACERRDSFKDALLNAELDKV